MSHPFDATLKDIFGHSAADLTPLLHLPTGVPARTLNIDLIKFRPTAEELLERARRLLQALAFDVEIAVGEELGNGVGGRERELLHYLQLTEKVCGTARRRVLLGGNGSPRRKALQHL